MLLWSWSKGALKWCGIVYKYLKEILIFVLHQLFFLLPHPQNQEISIGNIISMGEKYVLKIHQFFLCISFKYYFPCQNKFCSLCVNTTMRPPVGPERGICALFNPEVVNLAYIFLRQSIHHLKLYANFFMCRVSFFLLFCGVHIVSWESELIEQIHPWFLQVRDNHGELWGSSGQCPFSPLTPIESLHCHSTE